MKERFKTYEESHLILGHAIHLPDGVQQSSTAIAEAVSYLTRKVDSKSREVKILQPTIATQNVSYVGMHLQCCCQFSLLVVPNIRKF